ncbi:MAG: hypothetical protein U0J83_03315 [Bulleidia sp.]|nr:hypothetical protein [Bulleidia sp.]
MNYFFSFAFIFIVVVRILLYKGKDDFGGYDERQEIIRGRGYKYGFLTLVFLETVILLSKDFFMDIPIEFCLLMMACVMIGCLVTILYWIWRGAYWQLRERPLPFALLMMFVIIVQIYGIMKNPIVANGMVIWDGGIFVFTLLDFTIILINVIAKGIMEKKAEQGNEESED